MPPLSAHHWSASPRSTCGQSSTSNISAHSVFLRHGCHSMVWNDGYLAVCLVIDFVAHQDERKRVRVSGLRLVQKLFSPLINGFERRPACTVHETWCSCVLCLNIGHGRPETHLSVVSNTRTQQSAPRKNAVPRLWNRSCPAVSHIYPHDNAASKTLVVVAVIGISTHNTVGLCTCIATRVSSIIVSFTTKSEPIVAL